jgi:polyisoprenoid-binding protein YceI
MFIEPGNSRISPRSGGAKLRLVSPLPDTSGSAEAPSWIHSASYEHSAAPELATSAEARLLFMSTDSPVETTSTSETGVVTYRFVADESKFTVQAFAEGLLSAFGHDPILAIKNFAGEVRFVPGSFESGSVNLTITADGIVLTNEVKEKDRIELEQTMREQVLEVAKYPEIVFVSSNISVHRLAEGRYRARVIGDLTLHGVTQKNLWITSQVTMREKDLQAQGDFSLKQTDFGIKPFSAAGGTIKLKNELKFTFDIVARKK